MSKGSRKIVKRRIRRNKTIEEEKNIKVWINGIKYVTVF
jgi:hypothetical protein